MEFKKAKETFRFFTRLNLTELTGLRASNITQLHSMIKKAHGSCIYHHTHRFLQQHHHLTPEPPNDFAYWVSEVLQEEELGEKLESIDTIHFPNITSLQKEIAGCIEKYIKENPGSKKRTAPNGHEFHLMRSKSFILPTKYSANDLNEFRDVLKKITVDSIYYHIFEAKLRLGKKTNDFSLWLETSLEESDLAKEISSLDPYIYTLEDLRKTIVNLIDNRIGYQNEQKFVQA